MKEKIKTALGIIGLIGGSTLVFTFLESDSPLRDFIMLPLVIVGILIFVGIPIFMVTMWVRAFIRRKKHPEDWPPNI